MNDRQLRIEVLGELRVRTTRGWLEARALGGVKPRQVLEVLVLARGAVVSKDRLIDVLWGDEPTKEVVATLETYVSVLRKKLQPGQPARSSVVRTVTRGYALDRQQVEVDLYEFTELASAARRAASDLGLFTEALRLGDAELLAQEREEWVTGARRGHAQEVLTTLVAGATCATNHGDHEQALAWARQAVACDELDEGSWHCLLSALAAAGRPADALRSYERCRSVFATELGCAPGSSLRRLHLRLLDQAATDDEDLADVIGAVLRLHTASVRPRVPLPRRSMDHAGDLDAASTEEARKVLVRLLRATA